MQALGNAPYNLLFAGRFQAIAAAVIVNSVPTILVNFFIGKFS